MRRPPEIIIGVLLAVAVFGMGMVFAPPFLHGEVEIASVKLNDWLLVLFNCLLVVFTAFLWWSTRMLWRITRDIADHQARDTRVLQRAYIGTKGDGIEQTSTGELVGQIVIRNVGKLPANDVRWFIDMTAGDEHDWKPPEVDPANLRPTGVLSIDTEIVRGGPGRPISPQRYWYVWA